MRERVREKSWEGVVAHPDPEGIELEHNGHCNGENTSWYSPDEARRIGQALILAADYVDEVIDS